MITCASAVMALRSTAFQLTGNLSSIHQNYVSIRIPKQSQTVISGPKNQPISANIPGQIRHCQTRFRLAVTKQLHMRRWPRRPQRHHIYSHSRQPIERILLRPLIYLLRPKKNSNLRIKRHTQFNIRDTDRGMIKALCPISVTHRKLQKLQWMAVLISKFESKNITR